MKKIMVLLTAVLHLLTGCAQKMDGDGMLRSYTHISQETAREMMAQDGTQIIVEPLCTSVVYCPIDSSSFG